MFLSLFVGSYYTSSGKKYNAIYMYIYVLMEITKITKKLTILILINSHMEKSVKLLEI